MTGTYIGNPASVRQRSLKGKTAILIPDPRNAANVLAQFDDVKTGLGYGWHSFPRERWRIAH